VTRDDYCYVTTRGRRTGQPHRIEIWYATHGTTLYLLAGGGRSSDWVQNALADPTVEVEIGTESYPGRARAIEETDEAGRARSLVFEKYAPRSSDDLSEWRDRALPIAIEPIAT
jgi:deazaflavin-dependent oxidoreductase (nitroreductase family)